MARGTFEESKGALVFDDFREAVCNTTILRCFLGLGLEPDLDDFEGLHDEHLRPSFVKVIIPPTIPLKNAMNLSYIARIFILTIMTK